MLEIEKLFSKLDVLKIFHSVKNLDLIASSKIDSGRKADKSEANTKFKALQYFERLYEC